MPNAIIIGTGSYVPKKVLSNHHFDRLGSTDTWIQENLGIKERRVVQGETTSDLATEAARNALEAADLSPLDLDLIVLATATPDRPAPATACTIQENIGATRAVAFDISAVCSGALFAVSTACQYIESGMYRRVLVIGADTFSNITDWERRDAVFFGDGAGAIVLSATEEDRGFLKFELHSNGAGKEGFTVPAGGCEKPTSHETIKQKLHFFQMDGRAVFETAIKVVPKTILSILHSTGVEIEDIRYLLPHQPSIRILQEIARQVGLPWEKVKTNMDRYANTSGGTIPIVLDETWRSETFNPGDHLLFASVGAGWTWGAAIYKC
jgi:3-oxoacyl-[acyl-carrier-protein] synthase-3